ncbi:MAG: DUF4157 domain-containing protein [Crocosphaera sp.]|nr:DUF4157 domain-containing protein [Crocosphaera sp.]
MHQRLNPEQKSSQDEVHPSKGWLQRREKQNPPEKEEYSPLVARSGLKFNFLDVPVQREPQRTRQGSPLNPQTWPYPVLQKQANSNNKGLQEGRLPNRTGLPERLKTGVENLSGYSLDPVRVHYNSPKPLQLQALAYTQGTDIHVAPGQEKHLPHEAWHVVQQMQGRVKPTIQRSGVDINDDQALEREADVMGRKVLQRKPSVPQEYRSPRTTTMNSEKLLKSDSPRNLLFGRQSSMNPIQMINVGWVPSNPGKWRHFTTTKGKTKYTRGGGLFGDTKKIVQDNIKNALGKAFIIPGKAKTHPVSDYSKNNMLTSVEARDLTPEVDHIVPVTEKGANDYENARVISSNENHPSSKIARPSLAQKALRIYTGVTISLSPAVKKHYGPGPYVLKTGANLTWKQARALARYSGQGLLNNWSDIDEDVVSAIISTGQGHTVLGVTIV